MGLWWIMVGLWWITDGKQAGKQREPLGIKEEERERVLSSAPVHAEGDPQLGCALGQRPQPSPPQQADAQTALTVDDGAANGAEQGADGYVWESHKSLIRIRGGGKGMRFPFPTRD